MTLLAVFFLAIATASGPAFAQSVIPYHPNSPARLGYGYDPRAPLTPYAVQCISSGGEENIDSASGISTGDIRVGEIRTREALISELGISASMEAHGAMASGSTSFSKAVSVSFESDSIVWAATVKVVLGRFRLKNPVPTAILSSFSSPADAIRVCGSELVTQVQKGIVASVIFEARNLSVQDKRDLSAALSANYEGGVRGGSFSSAYNESVKRISQRSSIRISTFVQGGSGAPALANIIDASDLPTIRRALSTYVATLSNDNAKPLEFVTSPLSQFSSLTYTVAPPLQQDVLWEIYSSYENITSIIRRIDELIKPTNEQEEYLKRYISEARRNSLAKTRDSYAGARVTLRDAGLLCVTSASKCVLPNIASELQRIDWPAIPEAPTAVPVSACRSNLISTVGSTTSSGATVGHGLFVLGLVGDQALFSSIYLNDSGQRIPAQTILRPRSESKVVDSLIRLGDFEFFIPKYVLALWDCNNPPVDERKVFGYTTIRVDYRKDQPAPSIEVVDVLGRRTTFALQ